MSRHVGGLIPWLQVNWQTGRNPRLWWSCRVEVTWLRTGFAVEVHR